MPSTAAAALDTPALAAMSEIVGRCIGKKVIGF
jgi:hypothetical protein